TMTKQLLTVSILVILSVTAYADMSKLHPGRDFEVLRDFQTYYIDKNRKLTLEHDISYKILTESARTEFGFYPVTYFPDSQNLEIISVSSTTNNQIRAVNKKLIQYQSGPS